MRKAAGIGAIQEKARQREEFQKAGAELAKKQLQQLQSNLEVFKASLQAFATKYSKDIKKDPRFRTHFQTMCNSIGVDPLASNKGFWSELLGVGDFYYELSVQIAQICISTRARNGGFIEIGELKRLVEKLRGSRSSEVSEDDIIRSIKTLRPLGNGFDMILVGGKKIIQSVPTELNVDFTQVLEAAEKTGGYVTVPQLFQQYKWDKDRAERVLDGLIKDGICWIDLQATPTQYYISSFH